MFSCCRLCLLVLVWVATLCTCCFDVLGTHRSACLSDVVRLALDASFFKDFYLVLSTCYSLTVVYMCIFILRLCRIRMGVSVLSVLAVVGGEVAFLSF